MKKNVLCAGVLGFVMLTGSVVCHAEKWDKNDYQDKAIESGYYDADSVKVAGKTVSWTEKYILTSDGMKSITTNISKHEVCKQNIAKKGDVTQQQIDYQIESVKFTGKGPKKTHELQFRGVARRFYNKANELICTDKDLGNEFKSSWSKIGRGSLMEKAYYDLVTKYKVKLKPE